MENPILQRSEPWKYLGKGLSRPKEWCWGGRKFGVRRKERQWDWSKREKRHKPWGQSKPRRQTLSSLMCLCEDVGFLLSGMGTIEQRDGSDLYYNSIILAAGLRTDWKGVGGMQGHQLRGCYNNPDKRWWQLGQASEMVRSGKIPNVFQKWSLWDLLMDWMWDVKERSQEWFQLRRMGFPCGVMKIF